MNARTILSFVTPSTNLAAGLFGALIACLSLFSTPAYAVDDWDVIKVTGYRYANTPSGGGIRYALGRYAEQITFDASVANELRRGASTRPLESRDTKREKCRLQTEADFEKCKSSTELRFHLAANACDLRFSRRYRGTTWGFQSIFGIQFAAPHQMCIEDAERKMSLERLNCGYDRAAGLETCVAL